MLSKSLWQMSYAHNKISVFKSGAIAFSWYSQWKSNKRLAAGHTFLNSETFKSTLLVTDVLLTRADCWPQASSDKSNSQH
jgi:hypothetical protein